MGWCVADVALWGDVGHVVVTIITCSVRVGMEHVGCTCLILERGTCGLVGSVIMVLGMGEVEHEIWQ
jgi:hypothetical protein